MAGTDISDTLLTAGQNEGIERAILPLPQLAYLQNARMRKNGRIAKRFGYGVGLSSGFWGSSGPPRCIGGSLESSFAICGDVCNTHAQSAANTAWVNPANTSSPDRRVPGAVSGWLPDGSFFPVPAKSLKNQTTTPCSSCYAFGCLWTAYQYTDPANPTDKLIRVAGTDIADQTVVSVFEYAAGVAGGGGIQYPRLVLIGTRLVLVYLDINTGSLRGRVMTAGGAFAAEIVITGGGNLSFDVYQYSSTACLFAISYGGNSVTVGTLSIALVPTTVNTFIEANPVTSTSIVGSTTTPVYLGYSMSVGTTTKVRVYTTGFGGGIVGTVTLTAADASRPLLCPIPAGGVRAVHTSIANTAVNPGSFKYQDVSAAAVLGANTILQRSFYPLSMPFFAGPSVYMWTVTDTGGPRYTALLQLAPPANFAPINAHITPLEMSAQDLLLSSVALDLKGIPAVSQLSTTAAYSVLVPTLVAGASTIATGHEFRVLQAKHYTDAAPYRSLQSIFTDRSSFVPCGNLTRIDDRGAIEEGFVHTPTIRTPVPAGGGALTPSSTYYYTAVYKSRNSNGRIEVSAPSDPVKAVMGVGQTQNTLSIVQLGNTQRSAVSIEIYRTLSDGQTFYLAAIIDSDVTLGGPLAVYVDQLADTAIASQPVLYTQVGQTLANCFPPASRFGCAGASRLFLGGLLRQDIVHASKLILGDQSPSFADSDAFRVVLPSPCTGVAWCDALVMFTAEGIYIASGDGPDDSGIGDFGSLSRLPFALGCIEPRSVFACDDGVFFQTSRGLYLLPRGFGVPQAVDAALDTLVRYPIICGVAAQIKANEQTVRWPCVNSANMGVMIVYDLVHKVWSVDVFTSTGSLGTPAAHYGIGPWFGGELAFFSSDQASDGTGIKLSLASGYDDDGLPVEMVLRTGDLRPFGVQSEGVISKLQLLADLRGTCTLAVTKTTEWGTSPVANRVFAWAAGDYQFGQLTVTEVELGNAELRDAMRLQLEFRENSVGEGLAYIAMSIEHEQGEGLKRVFDLSRVT